jgi:hypothetical protein
LDAGAVPTPVGGHARDSPGAQPHGPTFKLVRRSTVAGSRWDFRSDYRWGSMGPGSYTAVSSYRRGNALRAGKWKIGTGSLGAATNQPQTATGQ